MFNLKSLCDRIIKDGVNNVFIEISSHSLELGRLQGLKLDACVFTNLTSEHLDFHKTMSQYAKSKNKMYELLKIDGVAVANADDSYSLASLEGLEKRSVTTAIVGPANYKVTSYDLKRNGVDFCLKYKEQEINFSSSLVGLFNIYNIISAIAVSYEMGLSFDIILEAVRNFSAPAGRMEEVIDGVYIDYAHTPDALENALRTLEDIGYKKIISVFGCGGDRDRSKRSLMADIAESFSDCVVVADDNPRSECPDQIFNDIKKGFKKNNHEFIHNRKQAIYKALSIKQSMDCAVLVAGKGHENCQITKEGVVDFDDAKIIRGYSV